MQQIEEFWKSRKRQITKRFKGIGDFLKELIPSCETFGE